MKIFKVPKFKYDAKTLLIWLWQAWRVFLMHGVMVSVTKVRVSPDLSICTAYLSVFPSEKGEEIEYYQSNIEGELINKLQEVGFSYDGVVLKKMEGCGNATQFYQGVSIRESFEHDWEPIEAEPSLTPVSSATS